MAAESLIIQAKHKAQSQGRLDLELYLWQDELDYLKQWIGSIAASHAQIVNGIFVWEGIETAMSTHPLYPVILGQRSTDWCISIDTNGTVTEHPYGLPDL